MSAVALISLVSRNYTCAGDDFICGFACDVIKEFLSTFREFCIFLGYENEGTLNYIAAILDG